MEPRNWSRFSRSGLRPYPLPGESDHSTGSPESGCGSLPPTWAWLRFLGNTSQSETPQEGTVLALLVMAVYHVVAQASVSPAVSGG